MLSENLVFLSVYIKDIKTCLFYQKKLPQENLNIYNHIDAINKVLLCKFALNMAICKTN